MSLADRDKKVIWHPYTQMQLSQVPVAIERGEGAYVFDENGKRYIDAISSWWVNLHGHSHPYIRQKVSEQLAKLDHVIFAGFTHEPAVQLAENLLAILPANQSRIFYSDNGSTATEVAVKLALQYWRNKGETRNQIIAFEHSYHGDTFGAMSVSARSSFTAPFTDFLFDVLHVPVPTPGMEGPAIERFKSLVAQHPGKIAAFIFEPLVLGAGGMLMYGAPVLNELIKTCKENAILTIADEVMTGFGRTGRLFAVEHLADDPDMICLSKGITGGTMALGATSCSAEVYNAFLSTDRTRTFFHGHSYTANPVACSAAIASYELLVNENCINDIRRISARHRSFVERNKDNACFSKLRSCGTILAMDIHSAESTSYFNTIRDRLYEFFLEQGIILRPLGNTVYVMPPYCISDEDLDYIYEAICAVSSVISRS